MVVLRVFFQDSAFGIFQSVEVKAVFEDEVVIHVLGIRILGPFDEPVQVKLVIPDGHL
jgi:hypothetical protein